MPRRTDDLPPIDSLPQRTAPDNPTKLRVDEIAHAVKSSLEMDDRGFVTELTVFATNPKD